MVYLPKYRLRSEHDRERGNGESPVALRVGHVLHERDHEAEDAEETSRQYTLRKLSASINKVLDANGAHHFGFSLEEKPQVDEHAADHDDTKGRQGGKPFQAEWRQGIAGAKYERAQKGHE